jgi:hypothetical protein
MDANTIDHRPHFYSRNFSRRDSFKNWPNAGENTPLDTLAKTPEANREADSQPHWEVLYSPNDAKRDRIAFSVALAITLCTLALTNLGILK